MGQESEPLPHEYSRSTALRDKPSCRACLKRTDLALLDFLDPHDEVCGHKHKDNSYNKHPYVCVARDLP